MIDRTLLIRYLLDFSRIYPTAFLCLYPVRTVLKNPEKTAVYAAVAITVYGMTSAVVCTVFGWNSNVLLLPALLLAFWAFCRALKQDFSKGKAAFVFMVGALLAAICSLLAVLFSARAEAGNSQPVDCASTSLIRLGIMAAICLLYALTAGRWLAWLLCEFQMERIWDALWTLPAAYAAYFVFVMPWDASIILVNRLQLISVLAVVISLFAVFLLLFLFYRMGLEYMQKLHLNQENQMLALESRRYTELRNYMEETRHLRHDFRQHLHVIYGLTENGRLEELREYLRQYEAELSEQHPNLCANAAVDAIAAHYDNAAAQKQTRIHWQLDLPAKLPLPEVDLCMILGNLLENAMYASESLPQEERSINVLCRMISPAMLGLIVENRYDGQLKKQGKTLLSTRHTGSGTGLLSIESAVHKYHGQLTLETENQIFRANVLLNL